MWCLTQVAPCHLRRRWPADLAVEAGGAPLDDLQDVQLACEQGLPGGTDSQTGTAHHLLWPHHRQTDIQRERERQRVENGGPCSDLAWSSLKGFQSLISVTFLGVLSHWSFWCRKLVQLVLLMRKLFFQTTVQVVFGVKAIRSKM